MPSLTHEGLIELFRNRPELAAELLRDVLHVELPAYSEARVESADLTDIKPAERRADFVVLLIDGNPVLGIVVEVQLSTDEDKRLSWPAYVVGLRARFKCPACVLVVTVTEAMARWSREPIAIGPGNVFCALVVGPSSVPIVDDVAVAEADPELAILSVLAHADGPHAEPVGRAALLATLRLSGERQLLYCDLILAAVSKATRAALEELMAGGTYEFQSDFFKNRLAKAAASGEAKGMAQAVLDVLEARSVRVAEEVRARILACSDTAQLSVWLGKAATATSVEQVL
jgi:hypothetical protein